LERSGWGGHPGVAPGQVHAIASGRCEQARQPGGQAFRMWCARASTCGSTTSPSARSSTVSSHALRKHSSQPSPRRASRTDIRTASARPAPGSAGARPGRPPLPEGCPSAHRTDASGAGCPPLRRCGHRQTGAPAAECGLPPRSARAGRAQSDSSLRHLHKAGCRKHCDRSLRFSIRRDAPRGVRHMWDGSGQLHLSSINRVAAPPRGLHVADCVTSLKPVTWNCICRPKRQAAAARADGAPHRRFPVLSLCPLSITVFDRSLCVSDLQLCVNCLLIVYEAFCYHGCPTESQPVSSVIATSPDHVDGFNLFATMRIVGETV